MKVISTIPIVIHHPMKRDPKDRGKADKGFRFMGRGLDLIESEWKVVGGSMAIQSVAIWAGTVVRAGP
jgi:hypothetical protein